MRCPGSGLGRFRLAPWLLELSRPLLGSEVIATRIGIQPTVANRLRRHGKPSGEPSGDTAIYPYKGARGRACVTRGTGELRGRFRGVQVERLSVRSGGLVTKRSGEIRDVPGQAMSLEDDHCSPCWDPRKGG
jgi:hypothetical protein